MSKSKAAREMTLRVERVPLSKLRPHPENPRIHPPRGSVEWDRLRKSLEHDYFDPLVWNERNGYLVSGHLRAAIMRDMGVEEADVVVVDYDDDTHRARMVAANKQIGEWDEGKLRALFEELQSLDVDMELTGFGPDEFEIQVPPFMDASDEPDTRTERTKVGSSLGVVALGTWAEALPIKMVDKIQALVQERFGGGAAGMRAFVEWVLGELEDEGPPED